MTYTLSSLTVHCACVEKKAGEQRPGPAHHNNIKGLENP